MRSSIYKSFIGAKRLNTNANLIMFVAMGVI